MVARHDGEQGSAIRQDGSRIPACAFRASDSVRPLRLLRIPARLGRAFQRDLGGYSDGTWALIPDHLGMAR